MCVWQINLHCMVAFSTVLAGCEFELHPVVDAIVKPNLVNAN
jgi:hypothetical protein